MLCVSRTYLLPPHICSPVCLCRDVSLGTDISVGEEVAIKLECVKTKHPQLHIESKIYKMMQGGGTVPTENRIHSHVDSVRGGGVNTPSSWTWSPCPQMFPLKVTQQSPLNRKEIHTKVPTAMWSDCPEQPGHRVSWKAFSNDDSIASKWVKFKCRHPRSSRPKVGPIVLEISAAPKQTTKHSTFILI